MKGVPGGRFNMRNARFRDDPAPLDDTMPFECSSGYARAYIHHLFKAGEILGMQILAQHNVAVMSRLARDIRAGVKNGTLDQVQKEWVA